MEDVVDSVGMDKFGSRKYTTGVWTRTQPSDIGRWYPKYRKLRCLAILHKYYADWELLMKQGGVYDGTWRRLGGGGG